MTRDHEIAEDGELAEERQDALYQALRTHRRAVLWLGVIIPLVIIVVGSVLIGLWLPDLPNPAATHWSNGPEPDGFDAPSTFLGLQLGLGGGMAVVFGGIAYGTEYGSPGAFTGRWMAIFNMAVAGFMSVAMCWSVAMQRGLRDAHNAGSATPSSWAATAVAVVLGGATWLILRATSQRLERALEDQALADQATAEGAGGGQVAAASPANEFALAPGERVMWSRTARMGKMPMIIVGACLVITVGFSIQGAFTDGSSLWVTGPVIAVVILAVVSCMTFRVVIGAGGMTVRSLGGWPRARIPARNVADVKVVDVDPFGQFGGWGFRLGAGRTVGFVVRKGPGLEVTRADGSRVVVTIDEAAEAAAVLRAASCAAELGEKHE